MIAYFREIEEGDYESVAPRLRELDIKEIEAYGQDPMESFFRSIELSTEVYTIVIDGTPEAIFGLGEAPGDEGAVIWFLSTDNIRNAGLRLIRIGRQWVKQKAQEYGQLYNFVHSPHVEAHAFIEMMGFEFTHVCIINDNDFLRFEMKG